MSSVRRSFQSNVLRWLPGLLISIVAIYFVAKLVQWDQLGSAMVRFLPWHAAAIMAITIIFLFIRAAVWRSLLNNQPKISETFWAVNQGYLLNNLLPFRLGEVGRAVLLAQQTGLPTAQVLSSVVIERSLDLAVAAGMLLSTLPLAFGMAWAKPVAFGVLVVVTAALAALYLMARFNQKVGAWIENFGANKPFIKHWVAPQVRSLLDGLSALTDPRRLIVSVGFLLVSWIVAVMIYLVGLLAITPHPPFWWGVFVDAVLALGVAVPSAPASIGTFEAAMVGALSVLGLNQTTGLAYAITLHFLQILVTGVLGFTGLVRQGRSISTVFTDLLNRKSTV